MSPEEIWIYANQRQKSGLSKNPENRSPDNGGLTVLTIKVYRGICK